MDGQTNTTGDFFAKTFVISMVTFLLLEAFLPPEYRYLAFLYIVLNATMLWILNMIHSGLGGVTTTVRLLATYIALSALLIETE
ncbi:hypothetical protein JI721_06780 [Alicyclobacillus cycloheptanicus]|uniref:Uncharacterized protein n=1 Tax=Alicyclobacillus cycloheptanicus TaxID=1457 RepID=A0ABT9XHR5_9BACL|nr:hypothetical protein [Alicyclobacillus cycloheptanicus]MDQ0189840.1 hypothetical protein [Alicyclobacillus cycloheptanicus]WDM02475.1 hypothetical protein JI721_06780 [Alicyclobacillus cycloheptanicus]